MPIPAGTTRIVYGGTLPRGEIWECSFWIFGDAPSSSAAANALAELWFTALTTDDLDQGGAVRVTAGAIWDALTQMTYVRVYVYPGGGPHAAYVGEHIGAPMAGTNNRLMPLQCAVVVSERTGLAGRRNRGRMYLPCANAGSANSGQLTTSVAQSIADQWAITWSDWNASGDNGTVVVVSAAGSSHEPVSQVQVDTRVDIQRRRANKEAVLGRGVHLVTTS